MLEYIVALGIPLAFLGVFRPPVIERIGPNGWVGLRIKSALRSRAAWSAAHRRAWPTIRNLCGATLVVGVGCLAGTWLTGEELFQWIALVVSIALVGMGTLFVVPAAAAAAAEEG